MIEYINTDNGIGALCFFPCIGWMIGEGKDAQSALNDLIHLCPMMAYSNYLEFKRSYYKTN